MDELPDVLELLKVQQARPQGAPAQAGPQGDGLPDILDLISGNTGGPTAQPQPTSRPGSRLGTFRGDRVRQAIVGQQDPQYAGIPNVASVIQQRGQSFGQIGREMGGWAVGASDADMGKAYAVMLGPDYVRTEKDANDYPVVVYRGADGREAKAYVNTPGLDMQDVARGVTGALPFAKAGTVVNNLLQSSPLLGRMVGQAAGQAVTSVAQDATGTATGMSSPTLVDTAVKAGIAGAGGAVGEAVGAAISPLVRRYITEPRLYNRATGELTEEGARLAQQAGVDPVDLTRQVAKDFAKAVAQGADPEAAFRQAGSREFGVRRSVGELAGNRDQLLREQQMRGGTYGQQARETVEAFDRAQRDDIVRATRGVNPDTAAPTIVQRLAPDRASQAMQMSQVETGRALADNTSAAFKAAKSGEREAWKQVPKMQADEGMRAALPDYLNRSIREFPVPEGGVAEAMEKAFDGFIAGSRPKTASSWRKADFTGDAVEFRKILSRMQRDAATPTDVAAAKAMMRGYDDWLDDTAVAMFPTDPMGAARYKIARSATKDLHSVFDGQKGTPGAAIMKQIMETADSAEGIVNALFTSPKAQIKNGTMSALQNLKRAYDTYLEPAAAKAAWDDIRLAYWIKATSDGGNNIKNPQALATAIESMMGTQGSVVRSLYTPAEQAMMRRLSATLREVQRKNPNTSWSAIGVGSLLKQGFDALLKTIGFDSVLGRTAAATFGGPAIRAYGGVQASRATGGLQGATMPVNRSAPRVGTNKLYLELPSPGAIGGAIGSQSNQ